MSVHCLMQPVIFSFLSLLWPPWGVSLTRINRPYFRASQNSTVPCLRCLVEMIVAYHHRKWKALLFIAYLGDYFRSSGQLLSHGEFRHPLVDTKPKGTSRMPTPLVLLAAGAVLVTYCLASSPSWMLLFFSGWFLAWNGYRILIYQRFLNPLSCIPGPKVSMISQQR